KQRLFSGAGPNQAVTGIVQDDLEDGQIFWLIINDQDVDGGLSWRPGSRRSSDGFIVGWIEVVSSRRPNRNSGWSFGVRVTLLTHCVPPLSASGVGRHGGNHAPQIAHLTYANFRWCDNGSSNASHFNGITALASATTGGPCSRA